MNLGELIIEYRSEHLISQRQFANMCGLSNGYISMLEKGMNPKTGQPVAPTIQMYQKLSSGMGITINELFSKLDDMPVELPENKNEISPAEAEEIQMLLSKLSPKKKRQLVQYALFLLSQPDE